MTQEELKEYRLKIKNLSVNEKKLRELHQMKLVKGEIQGPLTGYPEIDHPEYKFYPESAILIDLPNKSMYEFLKDYISKIPKATALDFYGVKISYKTLLKKIDDIAESFNALGIKKGDKVLFSMANTPETIYSFYALNKLGAVVVPVDPRLTVQVAEHIIGEINPKCILTIDMLNGLYEKLDIKDKTKIISVSSVQSIPSIIKKGAQIVSKITGNTNELKEEKIPEGFISWKSFVKNKKKVQKVEVSAEDVAAIIYTGGTTGKKKGVKCSNNAINAMTHQHINSGIDNRVGQKFLGFLPIFIAYGVESIHMSLCLGWDIVLLPKFEVEELGNAIKKYNPNVIFASPVHYEHLMAQNENIDMSNIDILVSGGDSMSKDFEEKFDKFFEEKGGKTKLGQGLGMTEAMGTMSVPSPKYIKTGTVGIPFVGTDLRIVDPDTMEIKQQNEIGELLFKGPSIMKGYINSEEDEKKVFYTDDLGETFLRTGDICKIDEDGYVHFISRIKRIINRGGLKVYPQDLENSINNIPNVIKSVVIGVQNEEQRNVPIAALLLEDKSLYNKTQNDIIEYCDSYINQESIPYGFVLLDDIPYTANGKVDYKKVEEICNNSEMSLACKVNEKANKVLKLFK